MDKGFFREQQKNYEHQRKSIKETLAGKNRISNHLKMPSKFKTSGKFVHNRKHLMSKKKQQRLLCAKPYIYLWWRWKVNEEMLWVSIRVDSASPVSFIKRNVLRYSKLGNYSVKIHPVVQETKVVSCELTDTATKIIRKIAGPMDGTIKDAPSS